MIDNEQSLGAPNPESGFLNWKITRRAALVGGASAAFAGPAVLVWLLKNVGKANAEAFWSTEASRRWFPVLESVAQQWGIEMLDAPGGALDLYEQIHWEEFREQSDAFKACADWSNALRLLRDPSAGYCARAAMSRCLFPEPSFLTNWYKGYPIDYPTKIGLLTALATQAVPLGFTEYTYGSNEDRGRLGLYADGTAPYPFEANRPKPGQGGEWFAKCDGVTPDQTFFKSDDFNLAPNWFSRRLIKMTYDPYYPIEGQIPDALRGEVTYWQENSNSRRIRIPVRRDLVFALVYGSPLALTRAMEDRESILVMKRQYKIEKQADVIAPEKNFRQLVARHPRGEGISILAA
ncbi:hypothetical protein HYS94_03555 [Candidatus Daviesbacteria bacterium]|nr:hypothetical protein [Candidatus Daviesbacteria bacterium]